MIDDRRILFLYIDWGFGTQVVYLAFAFSIVSFYFLLATFVWAGYLVLFGSKKFCNSGFLILGLSLNLCLFFGGFVSSALAWRTRKFDPYQTNTVCIFIAWPVGSEMLKHLPIFSVCAYLSIVLFSCIYLWPPLVHRFLGG